MLGETTASAVVNFTAISLLAEISTTVGFSVTVSSVALSILSTAVVSTLAAEGDATILVAKASVVLSTTPGVVAIRLGVLVLVVTVAAAAEVSSSGAAVLGEITSLFCCCFDHCWSCGAW